MIDTLLSFSCFKKLVSVGIFLTFVVEVYAWSGGEYKFTAEVSPTGAAKVYVSESSVDMGSIRDWKLNSASIGKKGDDKNETVSGTAYAYVYANSGYTFTNWTQVQNIVTIENQYNNPLVYSFSGKTDDDDEKITANFLEILKLNNTSVIVYKSSTKGCLPFSIVGQVNKTTDVIFSSDNDQISFDNISNIDGEKTLQSFTSQGSVTGDISLGDNIATITVTPSNNANPRIYEYNPKSQTVSISVREVPIVTFHPVIEGEGTYYYQQKAAGGTLQEIKTQDKEIECETEAQRTITLTSNPDVNSRFNRWVIKETQVDGTVSTRYEYYTTPYTFTITTRTDIEAEYISKDNAYFIVKGYPNEYYNVLEDAFQAAERLGKKEVVVKESGNLFIGDRELNNGKYEFEIPTGYTLLVPGDENNTIRTELTKEDLIDFTTTPSLYRKLTLLSNTRLIVNGNICVYAPLSSHQLHNGKPATYGQIDMQNGSQIVLNDGSILTVFGYITGNPEQSQVLAKAGSKVYEAFQLNDWRGGTATSTLSGNTNRVFPFGQYYVQSIETKLTLEKGAVEFVSFGVVVSSVTFPFNLKYIGESNSIDTEEEGLFCLGDGAELSKWYNGEDDRQVYEVKGTKEGATAKFGIVYLTLSALGTRITVSSKDYVMPITNNFDISLSNIELHSLYDFVLLADATVYIAEDATFVSKGDLFVYDKEYSNTAYFYPDKIISPIQYTAYHGKAPGLRKVDVNEVDELNVEKVDDARLIIDGKFIVESNSEGKGFYTTAKGDNGSSSEDGDYGAYITSNGGGCVHFKVIGSKEVTYQCTQVGTDVTYVSIPVSNARLRNADGTYETVNDNEEYDELYTYSISEGKWVLLQQISLVKYEGHEFNVKLPEESVTRNVVCKMNTLDQLTEDNFVVDLEENDYFTKGTPVYDSDSKELRIPITYKVTKNHSFGNKITQNMVVTWKDANFGTTIGAQNIELSAIEDYTPIFSVKVNGIDPTMSGSCEFPTTTAENVSRITWKKIPLDGTVANSSAVEWNILVESPFSVEGGEILYSPNEKGEHEKTLTIVATYKDNANKSITYSVGFNLKGKAVMQQSSLAFSDQLKSNSIYQGDIIDNIFADLGNNEDIIFTYSGDDASQLVVITKQENGNNYTLTVNKLVDVKEKRTITIIANQGDGSVMAGAERKVEISIFPPVVWLWADLYYGNTYKDPLIPSKEDEWTLTKVSETVSPELVEFSGNTPESYQVVVGSGGLDDVSQVKFLFKQGDHEEELISNIFADPRVLPYCVDLDRHFRGVTTSKNGVSFEEMSLDESTIGRTTFQPGSSWVIQMIGMPSSLHFTTSGEGLWTIQESVNGLDWTDVIVLADITDNENNQKENLTFALKNTTQYVSIQYAEVNTIPGVIEHLCVEKFGLQSSEDVVYLPIPKDGSIFSKTLVVYHVDEKDLLLSITGGLTASVEKKELKENGENSYYETTIRISGKKETINSINSQCELTIKQNDEEIKVVVYTAEFPQGLPIQLDVDDTKRFYFTTTELSFVYWNEDTKQVVFRNPGASNAPRSMVMAFEGAPNMILFNTTETAWNIYESSDGKNFRLADNSERKVLDGSIYQGLDYTSRYVMLECVALSKEEVKISNLEIKGIPMLFVNPDELEFSEDIRLQELILTAINLKNIRIELDNTTDFQMSHGSEESNATYTLTSADYPDALGVNKVGNIVINTKWITNSIVNDGVITIYNVVENKADSVLAKVKLVGAGKYLRKEDADKTGIYTGIPDGTRDTDGDGDPNTDYKYTFHGSDYEGYQYHEVDLSKAFAEDGTALFDYLFVYGETKTKDETKNITAPSGDNGSNARTPYYVYIRDVDAYGKFDRYRFVKMVDNANIGDKNSLHIPGVTSNVSSGTAEDNGNTLYIDVPKENGSVRVYISGFCPYASTGTSKYDEGVFFFRGGAGSKLDVYLEDAHIVARNKMADGQPFYTRGDKRNPTFTEGYARGSGGVLVFENVEITENLMEMLPFEVTIHTLGNNLLKSNYGCFNYFFGMDPFQISAPIHVRLHSADHVNTSKTTLNFTDEWPTALNVDRTVSASTRTNGFLSLQKLNNNAPSIDLGNPLTEVNFRGGQVELQNAQIVSTNYKTTLAISYRAGEYGSDNLGLRFAYGIGTDDVGGSVNFYDGTVTIQPMWVAAEYKDYYLIDKDADGNDIKRETGKTDQYGLPIYEYLTTCLRCPKNTKVYGGSICWLRACQHVTSKGGAPSDGNSLLGQYIYEFGGEDTKDETTGLVTNINFPGDVASSTGDPLANYYNIYHPSKTYGIESVTPDAGNKLYFWIPEGYGEVTAERDNILTTWKACMTEISAGLYGKSGSIGGDIPIEQNEEVKYLLYCKIDENIQGVISAGDGDGENKTYSYKAPVKVPDVALNFYGQPYAEISPTFVGGDVEHEVLSDVPYTVTDKIYYVTTATADVWQTFTAPFDVKNIWVLETYKESELEATELKSDGQDGQLTKRQSVLLEQARHNADFASFFAVAMAIGTTDSFDEIYNSYIEWAKIKDRESGLYTSGDYSLRGRYQLTPYINLTAGGTNWNSANFYLNHNRGNWQIQENEPNSFTTQWSMLSEKDLGDGILLHKGETYSMLFPYCVGCLDEDEEEREEWDYWSGKFIIFESTDGQEKGIHTIKGRNFLDETIDGNMFEINPEEGQVVVTGNSTFAFLEPTRENIYSYYPTWGFEGFYPYSYTEDVISPTTAFLYGNVPTPEGASVMSISRMGKINYRTGDSNGDDTPTGGEHVPTVGGDSDIFVTSVADGINIAVSEAQYVGVFSANGTLLYNGWVETAVNVNLVSNGVYVVVGENNSVKVVY